MNSHLFWEILISKGKKDFFSFAVGKISEFQLKICLVLGIFFSVLCFLCKKFVVGMLCKNIIVLGNCVLGELGDFL